MPNQDLTAPSPVDACPVCRARNGDSASLYAPNGAVIRPNDAHPEAPTVTHPHDPPAPDRTPETGPSEPPTQSIQFWQGLAAGLAAAIFTLFLIAVLLAG